MIRAASTLLLSLALAGSVSAAPAIRHVAQGELAGSETDGVLAFRGIPYAAAPVGDLRWTVARTAPGWRASAGRTGRVVRETGGRV